MFYVKERILVDYPSVFAQFRHRHLCQRFCQHAFAWRLEDMFTRTYAENWYFNFTNSVSIQIRRPTCFWRPNFYWFNNQHISTYILISIPVSVFIQRKVRHVFVTWMSSQSSSSSSSTFFFSNTPKRKIWAGRTLQRMWIPNVRFFQPPYLAWAGCLPINMEAQSLLWCTARPCVKMWTTHKLHLCTPV